MTIISVRRRTTLVGCSLAVAIGAAATTGCGSSSSSSSSQAAASSGSGSGSASGSSGAATGSSSLASEGGSRPKTLYLINPSDSNPWAARWAQVFDPLMQKGGIKVTRLTNPFDPVQESQEFTQAISQKPGAIVVFAADGKAVVPSIKRAQQAGVPVFNTVADISPQAGSGLASNIVSNAAQLGEISGKLLVQGLQKAGYKKANILVLSGVATQSVVIEQIAALRKYLAKFPQYKIVEVQDTQWDQTKAQNLASQVFAQYAHKGGIQGVMGSNDANAAGAIEAARQQNLKVGGKNGMVVVSAACFPVGIKNISDGLEYGTASEAPGVEATDTAKLVLKWFGGQKIATNVRLPETAITKANVNTVGKRDCTF